MTIRSSGTGASPIRALFEGGAVAGLTDAELLDRFVAGQAEAAEVAFAAIVHRHGPMVLGVCRRIVADRHAADDAFQATFLILARRAGSVRVGDSLGRWLYGVGRRVALRERAAAARRPRSAGPSAEGWEARPEADRPEEVRGALDVEVARLPRRMGEVVALCHFEGFSFAEVASRIGCPVGTVGSRLTRGRALLKSRLLRRGFGPAAVLMAADRARAEVPPALAGTTARIAASGPSGTIPAAVLSLSTETARSMIMLKVKYAAAATLAAGMIAGGAWAIQPLQGPPEPSGPRVSPAPPPAPKSTLTQDYEALVRECRGLVLEQSQAIQKGEAAAGEFRRKHPGFLLDEFSGRFLELARAHPADPSAFDALLWVAVFGFTTDASDQAATILARDHGRDPRLWKACQEMRRGPVCPPWGILLGAIHRDAPDRALKGRAAMALASYNIEQARFVRIANTPGPGPYQGQFFPAARMEQLRKLDTDAMDRDAERLCELVLRDYADIRPVSLVPTPNMEFDARTIYRSVQDSEADKGTLGELARATLDEVRAVNVGKPAPEIEGEDDRGRPMKLGDFRGKVVVLSFSGDWCGPCVSMYPDERALAKRFEGRPFAMLGVNSDETRAQLLKSVASGTITWRCWWDPLGEGGGPIARAWHVSAWPTIFAVDHRGIIRVRSLGTVGRDGRMVTGVDEAVEALVVEAERAARE